MCKCREYQKKIKELEKLIYIDPLTKIYNRRYFDMRLKEERERYRRYGNDKSFSIAIVDVDNFKIINDKYGHKKGDSILKNIAKMLKDKLRKPDIVCRYGGDEFAVIMPETKSEQAKKAMENVFCHMINGVTISVGIAELNFRKADKALLLAKRNGKNRKEIK